MLFSEFTQKYPLSKTLQFKLIPYGNTEEIFAAKRMLEEDEQRAKNYAVVKKCIDRYHKAFIEQRLSGIKIDNVEKNAELYYKSNRTEEENAEMEKLEKSMRVQISDVFVKDKHYKDVFGKELIEDYLPVFDVTDEEKQAIESFKGFSTYFINFYTNRKNMYVSEEQSTAVPYRCINDNLPKYLDNARCFERIASELPAEDYAMIENDTFALLGKNVRDVFDVKGFSAVLAQSGIDSYNDIIGGYTCSDGSKNKGINEYINLYNQTISKKSNKKKLPLLKPLFKQILSDRESISFIPEQFKNDDEVLRAVYDYYDKTVSVRTEIVKLFNGLASYDFSGIYVSNKNGAVTDLSQALYDNWNHFAEIWEKEYEESHPFKADKNAEKNIKKAEKYNEDKKKAYKNIKSFSLAYLNECGDKNVCDYYSAKVRECFDAVQENYAKAEALLSAPYSDTKKLCQNDSAVELIKNLLDSLKELERLIKPLLGSGKEEYKDDVFYGQFEPLYKDLSEIDRLYDKVRNYVTQKPYSKDKIKLNFGNPQFLGGWDKNKEKDYRCVMLLKDGNYYLAIMDKCNPKVFENAPACTESDDSFVKMEYKLLPGPNKMLPKVFFAKSNIGHFAPSKRILTIREKETFKKGDAFNIKDCHELIDFFKDSIEKHEDWKNFGFSFSPTSSYNDISEFYNEVRTQGYSIKYANIPTDYINEKINNGELYVFRLYNKDFSEYSHGTPNLHTLYWKALFDEQNLADVVYKMNGEAEMFYRKPSIEKSITHPANKPIKNKNPQNTKPESTFEYDLCKDKRYSERQFSVHIPITLNFKALEGGYLNNDVRSNIRRSDENYIIGIDRGERNLLYICVINDKNEIVEQTSLNEIVGDNGYKVDYHKLLDEREAKRDESRKSWTAVEGIKELKEGYMSQVVHKICCLAVKYNAVIAMEDLNRGFMNSRFKVEKQVYTKFENMLSEKLKYLVDKKQSDKRAPGGLYNAYQLTNQDGGVRSSTQDGIIFYVPAYLTSKIDPVTGFASLVKFRYESAEKSRNTISLFDGVGYDEKAGMFRFDIDYAKISDKSVAGKTKWSVYTNGDRIETRRSPEANNKFISKSVNLNDEFKKLFSEYGIEISADMKDPIISCKEAAFFEKLFRLISLTVQMRNSVTGTDEDYLISPVTDENGIFFDSRNYCANGALPCDADANGAYNIARKCRMVLDAIRDCAESEIGKVSTFVSNSDWLKYAQK